MDIGVFHPQIVHFVIALLCLGVGLRILSLIPKLQFVSPVATLLIVLGTIAAVLAAKAGDDAHSIPERIPGARDAVVDHEEWGNRTRNLFLVIAAVELAVFALSRNEKRARIARGLAYGSAVLGLVGMFFLYETGEHGGEIVYKYAGGVGTRFGDPEDVRRLLIAGLYHNAMEDREAGRKEDAARLIDELARRAPEDLEVRLLLIESHIRDRGDPATALKLLNATSPPTEERLRVRAGLLRVDAFEALGQVDSAKITLGVLKQVFPENQSVQGRQEPASAAPAAAPVRPESIPPATTTRD